MSDQSRGTLTARIESALDHILESTGFRISEDWLNISLTMPQVRLLLVLLAEERMRMSILASTLGTTFSGATGLVDRLVERELVERETDPDDRRTVVCVLTNHGKELAEQLLRIRHLQWDERLRPLTVKELTQVTEAMELIVSASHRDPQP